MSFLLIACLTCLCAWAYCVYYVLFWTCKHRNSGCFLVLSWKYYFFISTVFGYLPCWHL
jgi:hypothetical protein